MSRRSHSSPLDRLCERYHIGLDYHDIWGRRQPVSPQTRRALLTAMGVPTQTPAVMEQALAQAEAADWRRPLPPVQVVWADEESIAIRLNVPADQAHQRFRWCLQRENGRAGGDECGEFSPVELEKLGQQTLDGETWQGHWLRLAGIPDPGYHRLELQNLAQPDRSPASLSLIVVPRRAYQPQAVSYEGPNKGRVWGPAVQLYAVRSARNWGIGDYTDLVHLLEFSARAGAALVGLNPLHVLFPHNPAHASPYSPSSRLFLNILYLDIEAVADFADCPAARQRVAEAAFQAQLRALRATDEVDYVAVAGVKMELLEMLYQHFRRHQRGGAGERAAAFEAFRRQQGEALRWHALYEALQETLFADDPELWGWPAWPESYRHPRSPAVARFAAEHEERVGFYEYCQWQAQQQLQAAGKRASELGMGVGLYQDLAVSVDVGGAEAWVQQDLYALTARIGSPPDDFNLQGQDWGLPPWRPEALREQAYAPFIATLRQNMRVAGALRIDHVMALMRLFWVTSGTSSGTPSGSLPASRAVAGAYVSYPFQDLLGILALESQRNRCLVIGEDLGTVPDAVREALHALGVLSYRLLYFEKAADGGFRSPGDFEPQALVAVTTHDLPTLAGYWQGRDLELREQLGLFPTAEQREQQVIGRAEDRARLLMALEREGLLPAGMKVQTVAIPEMTPALAEAVHRYLARTPSKVLMVQLEDMLGQREQVNLPGTTDQYLNWRRRLGLELEQWNDEPRLQSFVSALREERGEAATLPAVEIPHRPAPLEAVIPHSTYRLQFHRDFGFDQGAEIVAYLHQLGISHCYASPCLQARPGSLHGYDIIDHDRLNPELGGDDAFERFSAALRERQMGLIMDMVPNHMGIMGRDNSWWLDVLENGPASSYAGFFDIDWTPLKDALRGKVLVPVLGDHYGSVLDRGELSLEFDPTGGAFSVRYYEHEFPIDPREYPRILGEDITRLEQRLGSEDSRLLALQSLITAFGNLPLRGESREALLAERVRDKEVHKASLARLCEDADIARFVDENLRRFNQPDGVDLLHGLLERQAWRLAYWRVASDEINYRRFFNINELAGLRVENTEVFEATHRRVLVLIADGRVQGLRIDHPDGLYDPAGYFRRLQRRVARPVIPDPQGYLPSGEQLLPEQALPLYLLVEKIVAGHERLRQDWAVHGTTGYEFTNLVNGLFVDAGAEDRMERIYREFVGESPAPGELVYDCKKLIMRSALASELNVLAQQLSRIGELERHTRDFTLNSLRDALSEVVAWFPIYRTYVTTDGSTDGVTVGITEEDRNYINWAVNVARKRSPAADTTVFDFVREVLLTTIAEGKRDDYRQRVTAFAMRFQQYTGPVMAKGLEDSAFYRYNRLLSLNEVGGEPERFGVSLAAFHYQNQERARFWPHAMLGSSTHDSKRSEDVRARINVLSELPGEWQRRVRRWARLNRNKKRSIDDQRAPCRNDEYLLYQTLIGAWPLGPLDAAGLAGFRQRIQSYLLKAVKEAKRHTSWINPNTDYEDAVTGFVEALLGDLDNNPFLTDFLPFQQQVSRVGQFNSLAQTLLKLTAPGVPDIYQGNELWDFSLVDPDNRRPVDYGQRRALLDSLLAQAQAAGPPLTELCDELLQQLDDGRAKLYLIWRGLQLRSEHSALFLTADYLPLAVSGSHAEHLCAFARRQGEQLAVIVTPRLIHSLAAGADPLGEAVWGETWIELPAELSAAGWENGFTGETLQAEPAEGGWRLSAGQVLGHFPVALLIARLAHPEAEA